ncbi:MAG: universal stress protein [Chloroflexi bacterium]|nr:universal stress protein [Chloroflexota bacterium]
MFQKILIAVDASQAAQEAVKCGQELAKLTGAQVILVHAHPKVPEYLGEPGLSETIARHVEKAEEILEPAAEALKSEGINVDLEILEGPPADAILRVAEVQNVDLIIMGARGLGTVASLLLGSVSQKVMAHATCPVMIVRASEKD